MLRFLPAVTDVFVERMRLGPRNIGTNENLVKTMRLRPLFGCDDERTADPNPSRAGGNDQTDDLDFLADREEKAPFRCDPAEQLRGIGRDAEKVIRTRQQSSETVRDLFGGSRVIEFRREARDPPERRSASLRGSETDSRRVYSRLRRLWLKKAPSAQKEILVKRLIVRDANFWIGGQLRLDGKLIEEDCAEVIGQVSRRAPFEQICASRAGHGPSELLQTPDRQWDRATPG